MTAPENATLSPASPAAPPTFGTAGRIFEQPTLATGTGAAPGRCPSLLYTDRRGQSGD